MESRLHQLLRSLCFNTGWKYAVFWKLNHPARMMLTWEEAYYDSGQDLDKNLSNKPAGGPSDACDPVGLILGKMSYQVYCLGEGIVGQVAVSGNHSWIFSDEHGAKHCDRWQPHFSAGIKTIVVVAAIPHGVVQLGSLHKIAEDLKFVDQIKGVFSHPARCENILTRQIEQEVAEPFKNTLHDEEAKDLRDLGKRSEIMSILLNGDVGIGQSSLYNSTLPTNADNPPLEFLDCSVYQDQANIIHLPNVETRISPFGYCAGYELLEALGPSFQKGNNYLLVTGKTDSHTAIDISEGMDTRSHLMGNTDVQLLEAVVAKVSSKGNETESEKSQSILNSAISSSGGYSFDQEPSSNLKSDILNNPREGVKINKKRARPGESCRPRPRDRQLIQERIKELRELIPNGSKCSIDTLLERTIKHMLFLQSITKDAENLCKCSASKLVDKDTGTCRLSCGEQGSTWAVEAGSTQKVCPLIVENINMNRQIVVEMVCDECNQFLEVVGTIRGLGLNILKGVSEVCGNNTLMCFLVEGKNSRSALNGCHVLVPDATQHC